MAGALLRSAIRHHPPIGRHFYRYPVAAHGGPHWAAIFTTIFAAAAAVGASFAGYQVAEARRARRATASTDLAAKWSSPTFEEARKAVGSFPTPEALADGFQRAWETNSQDYYVLVREPNFFEDLGVAIKMGGLEFNLIKHSLGSVVVTRWAQWRRAIGWLRATEADVIAPQTDLAFSEFEALARRMASDLGMAMPED